MCATHTLHRALFIRPLVYVDVSYFHFRCANIQFVYILLLRSIHDITKTTQDEKSIAHSFAIPSPFHLTLEDIWKTSYPNCTQYPYRYLRTRAATRHAKHIPYIHNGRLSKYKQNKKSQCWIILFIFLRIRKYIFFVRFFSARPIPGKAACLVNMG